MVGAFQIFNFGIGQRPTPSAVVTVGVGPYSGLHRPLEQGRNFRLVHRLQQILHGVHPVGAVCVGRGACHKGQRRAASLAAQLCRRRKPFGPGYRRKLDEVQLVPQPGGILLQKRFRALQLLLIQASSRRAKNSMHWCSSRLRSAPSGLQIAMRKIMVWFLCGKSS